jgi:hypothetical protein
MTVKPGSQRGMRVAECLRVCVVEMHSVPFKADAARSERAQQGGHVSRGSHSDGVAQGQLIAAELQQPPGDVDYLADGHVPFPGIAEAHRQVGPHP